MALGRTQRPTKAAAERRQAIDAKAQRQHAPAKETGRLSGLGKSSANQDLSLDRNLLLAQNLPLAENIRVMPLIWVARSRWPGWSTDHRNTGLYSFWPFLLNC